MNKFKIQFYLIIVMVQITSCTLIKSDNNNEQLLSTLKERSDKIELHRNEIKRLKSRIDYYESLLLPYKVTEPTGLIICVGDPNYFSYYSFYQNSYFEDYYEGPNGSIIKGTWSFKNDTIYFNSSEYAKPQSISFTKVLEESKSLRSYFSYCIVDKMTKEEMIKKN